MAERVVDLLEVIEVEQQQRDVGTGALGLTKGDSRAGQQQAAVGQTSQGIVRRLMGPVHSLPSYRFVQSRVDQRRTHCAGVGRQCLHLSLVQPDLWCETESQHV